MNLDLATSVPQLQQMNDETKWVEFKVGRHEPSEIGEYLSTLSNGARLW